MNGAMKFQRPGGTITFTPDGRGMWHVHSPVPRELLSPEALDAIDGAVGRALGQPPQHMEAPYRSITEGFTPDFSQYPGFPNPRARR